MQTVETSVLIIGAGPAGVAAANAAASHGTAVAIVDDNNAAGGQIWRGAAPADQPPLAEFARLNIAKYPSTRIFDRDPDGSLIAHGPDGFLRFKFKSLILATGARERFLPFPGWTLPNVCGAGGLQALVKGGVPIAGRRVVVAGSGPLLLAVAVYLKQRGARVLLIAEQTPPARLRRFALGLLRFPSKLIEGARLQMQLAGIPYRTGCWPVSAAGTAQLESVTLQTPHGTEIVPCDYLACGFGLVPNIELPQYLGCRIQQGAVVVDASQQTSVAGVYAVGETIGIGGLETALLEGAIAGHMAADQPRRAAQLQPRQQAARRFAAHLENCFQLRADLRALPRPDTIVCRCEDVPFSEVTRFTSRREAKLHTRCGMGPCQGRVCGPALEFLTGWGTDSIRPPLYPVPAAGLARHEIR